MEAKIKNLCGLTNGSSVRNAPFLVPISPQREFHSLTDTSVTSSCVLRSRSRAFAMEARADPTLVLVRPQSRLSAITFFRHADGENRMGANDGDYANKNS
jgi:hypothetical protein